MLFVSRSIKAVTFWNTGLFARQEQGDSAVSRFGQGRERKPFSCSRHALLIFGTIAMKRTLMLKNQELLDFEIDLATGDIHVLDAPDSNDSLTDPLGLTESNREVFLAAIIRRRRLSSTRDDLDQILKAFGVRSKLELLFLGHGLSLNDMLWFREPGSSERWEDVNFFDNDWDPAYSDAFFTRDYTRLAGSSPDIPDLTTGGKLRKAWLKTTDGIFLIKESLFENQIDLEGALLAAELGRLLFGEDAYQPMDIVERNGQRFSASPLMLARDEELLQGYRLFAMSGYDIEKARELMGPSTPECFADIISHTCAAEGTAPVAKVFTFKALSLLSDMHAGNLGVIRNAETGACRVAPPFDYDRSFGFPGVDIPLDFFCKNPDVIKLMCAWIFSDLDSSWDWSWYDPRALDGFEDHILETYANIKGLPANFAYLVASAFVMQRDYVNSISCT